MDNNEKINELEQRILRLEKIEKRRKIMSIISICFYLIFIIAFTIMLYKAYSYVKSYRDKLENITNIDSKKIDEIKDNFGDFDFNIDNWFN